jgi:cation/acetate symporter
VMLSKLMVLVAAVAAAWVASLRIAGILPFVTAAFSLAAAAFFPALVLGIFWRRATHGGAVAGMLTGLGVCVGYMLAGLPAARAWLGFSPEPWRMWGIDPMAAGVFGVPAGALVLMLVSLLTPRPGQGAQSFVQRLHEPGMAGDVTAEAGPRP